MSQNETTAADPFTAVMAIDENGDYALGKDREAAWTAYTEEVGWDDANPLAIRFVELAVVVPLPAAVVLTGLAPADGQPATLVVK